MTFTAIIPARYASTRFPGKPLAVLGGKTVIQRVYEQVKNELSEVYVATDDKRIFKCVESFGGKAIMTRTDHKSGTDRIEEAVEKISRCEVRGARCEYSLSGTKVNTETTHGIVIQEGRKIIRK